MITVYFSENVWVCSAKIWYNKVMEGSSKSYHEVPTTNTEDCNSAIVFPSKKFLLLTIYNLVGRE